MEIITTVFSFIWNIIKTIKDILTGTIGFINTIVDWIKEYINILPDEWKIIILPVLGILIGIYLYRFVR